MSPRDGEVYSDAAFLKERRECRTNSGPFAHACVSVCARLYGEVMYEMGGSGNGCGSWGRSRGRGRGVKSWKVRIFERET